MTARQDKAIINELPVFTFDLTEQDKNNVNECLSSLSSEYTLAHLQSDADQQNLFDKLDITLLILNVDRIKTPVQNLLDNFRKNADFVYSLLLTTNPPAVANRDSLISEEFIPINDPWLLTTAIRRGINYLALQKDLTQQKHGLAETEDQWLKIIEASHDAVAILNDGVHVYANTAYKSLFGLKDPDLQNSNANKLIDKKDAAIFNKLLSEQNTQSNIPQKVHCVDQHKKIVEVLMSSGNINFRSQECTWISYQNLSSDNRYKRRILELSHIDQQTGLFNRLYFIKRLDALLNSPSSKLHPVCLIQLSIENFEQIRSNCSLEIGDQLLKLCGKTISHGIAPKPLTGRLGEHDFVIVPDAEANSENLASLLLGKLNENVRQIKALSINPVFSMSIAYSDKPTLTMSSYALLNRVIQSQHTSSSGNSINSLDNGATPNEESLDPFTQNLVTLIDHALINDDFQLNYQPIISLQGETRENYGIYVRLIDNNNEVLLPDEFLLPAEKANRMVEIDRWVIRHAIEATTKQRILGYKTRVFINLSAASIYDSSILLWICDCLREFEANGAWLIFQFKEIDLLQYFQEAQTLIEGLKKVNCLIAIDRFTNTRNARAELSIINPDIIKIPLHFGLREAPIEVMRNRGIKTVITEIEQASQLSEIWQRKIDYVQGHYIQEPVNHLHLPAMD